MKRILLLGLLGGLLTTGAGCGLGQAIFCYRPCVGFGGCDSAMTYDEFGEPCGPSCGGPRRAVHGPRRAAVCDDGSAPYGRYGDACDAGCDPCGPCRARPWYRGPLSCVFALFSPACWQGRACGERYWGDFYSDPPDCWDPCDGYGNYTGGGSMDYGYADGGCKNCGGNHRAMAGHGGRYVGDMHADDGTPIPEGQIISQTDRVVGTPATPASQPRRAKRP